MERGQQGSKNPAARAWLAVRIAIVVLGGFGGTLVVSPDAKVAGGSLGWRGLLLASGGPAAAVIVLLGLQYLNPRSAKVWTAVSAHAVCQ